LPGAGSEQRPYAVSVAIRRRLHATAAAAAGLSAVLVAYVATSRGATAAAALLLAAVVGAVWAHRLSNSVLLGIALVLVLPASFTLGAAQADPLRIGALLALVGLLGFRGSRLTLPDIGALGLVLWPVSAWFIHTGGTRSLQTLGVLLLPFAFYLAARTAIPFEAKPRVLSALNPSVLSLLMVCGVIASVTVFIDFAAGHAIFTTPETFSFAGVQGVELFRPAGVFESPPGAAIAIAMLALAVLPLWRLNRRLVGAAVLLMLAAVAVTLGRAAWLGLLIALGLLLWLWFPRLLNVRRLLMGGALLAVVGALVVVPLIQQSQTYQLGFVRRSSGEQRSEILKLYSSMATDSTRHVLIGRGPGLFLGYHANEPVSLDPDAARAQLVFLRGGPHSDYVRTFLEGGAVQLAFLLMWLGGTIYVGISAARSGGPRARTVAALTAAVTCYAVASRFHDTRQASQNAALAAFISGLVVAWSQAQTPTRDAA
jgi:O-antigen ligase